MQKSNNNTEVSTEKATKNWFKKGWNSVLPVIIGIGTLLAVASIVYSSAVIILGTEGLTPLVLIAPQAVLALVILIKKFVK